MKLYTKVYAIKKSTGRDFTTVLKKQKHIITEDITYKNIRYRAVVGYIKEINTRNMYTLVYNINNSSGDFYYRDDFITEKELLEDNNVLLPLEDFLV